MEEAVSAQAVPHGVGEPGQLDAVGAHDARAAQLETFNLSDACDATLVTLGTLVPGVRFIKRGGYDRTINRATVGRRIVRTGR